MHLCKLCIANNVCFQCLHFILLEVFFTKVRYNACAKCIVYNVDCRSKAITEK